VSDRYRKYPPDPDWWTLTLTAVIAACVVIVVKGAFL
jgi:hypothetical protein